MLRSVCIVPSSDHGICTVIPRDGMQTPVVQAPQDAEEG